MRNLMLYEISDVVGKIHKEDNRTAELFLLGAEVEEGSERTYDDLEEVAEEFGWRKDTITAVKSAVRRMFT